MDRRARILPAPEMELGLSIWDSPCPSPGAPGCGLPSGGGGTASAGAPATGESGEVQEVIRARWPPCPSHPSPPAPLWATCSGSHTCAGAGAGAAADAGAGVQVQVQVQVQVRPGIIITNRSSSLRWTRCMAATVGAARGELT